MHASPDVIHTHKEKMLCRDYQPVEEFPCEISALRSLSRKGTSQVPAVDAVQSLLKLSLSRRCVSLKPLDDYAFRLQCAQSSMQVPRKQRGA